MTSSNIFSGIFYFVLLVGCAAPQKYVDGRPEAWSQRMDWKGFTNSYRIDDGVYRSEQPNTAEMKFLEANGIKTVLNLRDRWSDDQKARGTSLQLRHVPINSWRMSYDDLLEAMIALHTAQKPVLVHCIHGADRTGCVIAAYRMVDEGWTKEEAIREFVEGGYGFHAAWFQNLVRLLEAMDVNQLKKDLEAGVATANAGKD